MSEEFEVLFGKRKSHLVDVKILVLTMTRHQRGMYFSLL